MRKTCAIILAAGLGKRMKSDLPKVIHEVCGETMIEHVLKSAIAAGLERQVLVIGHKGELVKQALAGYGVEFVVQPVQLGTGHAVQMAVDYIGDTVDVAVVLTGDTPLLKAATVAGLLRTHERNGDEATVLTAEVDDATGYGRIIRGPDGDFLAIREHNDSTDEERRVREINSGIFCFEYRSMVRALRSLDRENEQSEYYLTDTIQILREQGKKVSAYTAGDAREVLGVNTIEQLRELEDIMMDMRRGGNR
jgi:bifunctional UDP-N-acetylglucosamine pyrophosphorylase/glucosamine-1-phosphate N-acetyltransferase